MPCLPFLGGIVCTRSRKAKPAKCFVRDYPHPGTVFCDWIIGRMQGPTIKGSVEPIRCSRSCCRAHADRVATDKDLCAIHTLEARKKGIVK